MAVNNLDVLAAIETRWQGTTAAMLDLCCAIVALKMARRQGAEMASVSFSVEDIEKMEKSHKHSRIFRAEENSWLVIVEPKIVQKKE